MKTEKSKTIYIHKTLLECKYSQRKLLNSQTLPKWKLRKKIVEWMKSEECTP